jgi:hypothetical protein
VDHADGTVTDDLTGLMWLKDADALETTGVGLRTWEEALAFIDALNSGDYDGSLASGGHTDWRLPNRKELISLLDLSGHPVRLPAGHPFTPLPDDPFYWTSDSSATDAFYAWQVLIERAVVGLMGKGSDGWVWPVRNGSFTAIVSDDDGDGIPDTEEMGPSGDDPHFDGNNDGTPDILQDNVGSTPTAEGDAYASIASQAGTTLTSVSTVSSPSPADMPPDVAFPYGFFDFTVGDVTPGGCITVTIYLPLTEEIDTYYKYGPTPGTPTDHWYEFLFDGTTGAEIFHDTDPQQTRIVLHLCDGQRGDDDLIANGDIVDVGAPGIRVADTPDPPPVTITPPTPGASTPVPGLTSWGVVAMACAMLIAGVLLIRRRFSL